MRNDGMHMDRHRTSSDAVRPAPGSSARPPGSPTPKRASEVRPDWYRDAVIYEVHVRAFRDSNGDGMGDFRGLTAQLDYLRDLGVTAVWLLPFYPSPLRDDGYDISDYVAVHPSFGTIRDFQRFIHEAHRRDLRVITELICNHTSDQHPWFQRARRAKAGSRLRDYYVWSDTPDRYPDARVIFKDFETSNWTWDPVAGAYYWHRFYSHQPDLNYDSPHVRASIMKVVDFWLDRGVDGLRLDAVPYLFERDGTDCENLPETHQFLRDLRRHVDEKYGNRMLLAEANQWPEDAAAYFGDGDECHMAFNFPVMPRMFMAIRQEDRRPIVDIVGQTPAIPAPAQWALFLRNHDELTLEMVTDEERDYMYRVYAGDLRARVNLGIRRRLAPLLHNHRRRIELMFGLLFSLPGTPVVYYGDEIGMGDNIYLGDRDSVRTPMQWTGGRNAGFSSADRDLLYLPLVTDPEHQFESVNVAVEQANPHSLLWWMKRLIAVRRRQPAFGRGAFQMLYPENRHILAFIRQLDDAVILVVANMSRFGQPFALELERHAGRRPVEMFGRIEFPLIGSTPYPLTLGPHEFLWFTLERSPEGQTPDGRTLARLPAAGTADFLDGHLDKALTSALVDWIQARPWYRGRGRHVHTAEIVDRFEVGQDAGSALFILLRIGHSAGETDTYLVPLTTATETDAVLAFADGTVVSPEPSGARIAALAAPQGKDRPFLVEAAGHPAFQTALFDWIAAGRSLRTERGTLVGRSDPGARQALTGAAPAESPSASGQDTPTVTLNLRHVLEPVPDNEVEVGRALAHQGVTWVPRVVGELEYQPADGEAYGAGFVVAGLSGTAGLASVARHSMLEFLELATTRPRPLTTPSLATNGLLRLAAETDEMAGEMAGSLRETLRSVGRQVGELHLALALGSGDPAFAPEPFTLLYQKSLFQSISALSTRALRRLEGRVADLPDRAAMDARLIIERPDQIDDRLRLLLEKKLSGRRIRTHGALTLASFRQTERGTIVLDLASERSGQASQRRLKRSPLKDVATMTMSIHQIALTRLNEADIGAPLRPEDADAVDVWARQWCVWMTGAFLDGHRAAVEGADLVPSAEDEWVSLLDALRLQQALEELATDLHDDPARVATSVRALRELTDV